MYAPSQPPGPKHAFLAYLRLYRDPLRYLAAAARDYGDIVYIRMPGRHDFLLNHPDYIRAILLDHDGMRRSVHRPLQRLLGQGLLTSRGNTHRKQRLLLQPIFHREQIATLGGLMAPMIARWNERWHDGETVNMQDEMTRMTMATAGRTLLNVDLESDVSELRDALVTVMHATRFNNLLVASKRLERLPLPANRRFRDAARRLDEFIYGMIAQRHAKPSSDPDLLSVLVRLSGEARKGMNDQKVRDQILTLWVGGHETIATALMWSLYLLATHPQVMAKLQAEIDAVIGTRAVAVSDTEQLPYARMVFAEAMRVYPSVWIMGRHALRETKINGCVIPKGAYVHVSQFLMHRDARYFPEPLRFDPERWQPEAVASRPRFSYFPFGAGGLQCIGESFAWTQALLAIATIAKQWHMRLAPGFRLELEPQLTLRSRHGMPIVLTRRT